MVRWIVAFCVASLAGFHSAGFADDYDAGRERFRERDYPAAIAAFERQLARDPDHRDALLDLGRAHSALQQWDEAVEAYERLIALEPEHAAALNNLGNVYYRTGVFESAAVYYDRALAARPDYILARYHYGFVLQQLNRGDEAIAQFDACLAIQPKSNREAHTQIGCRFHQGVARFRGGSFNEAAAIMHQVLGIDPSHVEARYYLGMALRRLGHIQEARQQLELHRQMLAETRSRPIRKDID